MDEDFRYGQLAVEGRIITPEQFDAAMTLAKERKQSLHEVLVAEGITDSTTAGRLQKALRRIIRDERAKSEGGLLAQKQVGGYKLTRRIGEGGMGEVYLAEQLNMHRQVALKVLHDKWVDDEEFRKRFLLEARAAGKLSHPHLIQVYDVGKYQGKYYFSMEYVDGVTAEDLIAHDGSMAIEKVVDIALQVCQALKYLASQDIVHRDIKPANIMLTKDGTVKLGDFGFIQSVYDAELMQEGTTLGTPDYISPEQARGERNLDVRSDVYSLGASMFHMLTGSPLFDGSCSKVMRDHIDTTPPDLTELRADVPNEMVRILGKMLAKDPIDRYQSADDLIADLEMMKIDQAADQGALPSTRSQILHVISAEKDRITELEGSLGDLDKRLKVALFVAMMGWGAAGAAVLALVVVSLLN
ncbi:MAG: serine/threonine-protein kinase [Planctomycetota bacterium]|jgi:serine/threonine protein kinase|nr:serine/threonine-protein kinase [Planctomycetota bacterium]